jgi:sugar phosphate isomerase/epimerase
VALLIGVGLQNLNEEAAVNKEEMNRRGFVKQSIGLAVVAGLGASKIPGAATAGEQPTASPHPIRLGGPVAAGSDDPEQIALAHRKLNYRAAYCPPKVTLKDTARIRAITDAFAKHDVMIAEVGRWVNILDPDAEKRRANIEKVTEGLALADALGARCCVDIAGSYNPKVWYGPHPENLSRKFFDEAVENARKIIDTVKPKRAKLCYEMMGWSLPDSPDSYLKMIKAVDREAFAVHLDPCNMVNSPDRFYHNTALLNEAFDKLGKWIVSCHAKDLTWDVEMNVHFREVRPGTGSLDYATYLRRLASLPNDAPLMLEHLPNAEEFDKARQYILDLGGKIGVSFG